MGSNPIPSANPLARSLMRPSVKRVAAVAVLTGCLGAAVATYEASRPRQSSSLLEAPALPPHAISAEQLPPAEVVPVPARNGLTVRLLDHYTSP